MVVASWGLRVGMDNFTNVMNLGMLCDGVLRICLKKDGVVGQVSLESLAPSRLWRIEYWR